MEMVTSRQIRAAAIALLNVAEIYDTAERGATDGFDMLACSGIKSLTSATGQHFGKDGAWSIHFTGRECTCVENRFGTTNEDRPESKNFISTEDAATVLGMTNDGVRKLVKSGRLAALRLGGKPTGPFLVSRASVVEYGAERKRRGPMARKDKEDGGQQGRTS